MQIAARARRPVPCNSYRIPLEPLYPFDMSSPIRVRRLGGWKNALEGLKENTSCGSGKVFSFFTGERAVPVPGSHVQAGFEGGQ